MLAAILEASVLGAVVVAGLVIVAVLNHRDSARVRPTQVLLVLYINLCVVLQLVVRRFLLGVDRGDFSILLDPGFGKIYLTVAVSIVIQVLALAVARSLFQKIVLTSMVCFLGTLFFHFWIGFGIVNFVWSIILSSALGGFLFVSSIFEVLKELVAEVKTIDDEGVKLEVLKMAQEEISSLLESGLKVLLALGASIGVSMSILFKDGDAAWRDANFQATAVSITSGFGLLGLALVVWLVRPYILTYFDVRAHYRRVPRILLAEGRDR